MSDDLYADILKQEGFVPIGEINFRIRMSMWWNPTADKRMQLLVLSVGRSALLKASKSYFLTSISEQGETWARDVGPLHDYLEGHFPEMHLSFSHFRDVPAQLAELQVRRRLAVDAPAHPPPTIEEIARLQTELANKQRNIAATDGLLSLSSTTSDLLTDYVRRQKTSQQCEIDQLQERLQRQQQRLSLLKNLQREYQLKGSAAAYMFTITSNLQVANDPPKFRDALHNAVKELADLHRYQVTQKLQGGRLNIQIAEVEEPGMAWIEQWMGEALSPTQMQRLGPEFGLLRNMADEHLMVVPDEPIVAENHTRHDEKHLAARVVSSVLQRLDKTRPPGESRVINDDTIPADAMPLTLGQRTDESGKVLGPARFPLQQSVHIAVCGTTGSGKSFAARVLIEEAAQQEKLSILVLDPRNQSAGILVPEDRPNVLQRYAEFGMKPQAARGFRFDYHAPALACATPLPKDFSLLTGRRSIVSFKGMDERDRCALAGRILHAVFEACSAQESEIPRLLVVVDEAHNFMRKRVDESAKDAAGQVERALDKIAREGRKFGIVLTLISQTMKDFAYELASVRQMATTKIFLRNSDREIEYAADIIGDGRLLVQLPTGTALVHNANWGVVRVRVRPPFSKVFEIGEAEIGRLIGNDRDPTAIISAGAQHFLTQIKTHIARTGEPLNMSKAAELGGITSKRKLLDLIGELERARIIRTITLPGRGRPRMIELQGNVSRTADQAPMP